MAEIYKEYADAFFALAIEEELTRVFYEELSVLNEVFDSNGEYMQYLSSPCIPLENKLKSIDGAFSGRVSEYTLNFLCVLCEKGRISKIKSIYNEYEALYFAKENIVRAYVKSAVALTEEEKEKLQGKLEALYGKTVFLDCQLDTALIGGVKVELDGRIFDGSVKNRMNRMKEVISR